MKLKEIKENAITFGLLLFAVALTYMVFSTVSIRILHPEYTESQILLKSFYWDYNPDE